MQKVTGQELKYSTIVGKPSEITFRFAEHVLAKIAQKMRLGSPRTLYMIGSVVRMLKYMNVVAKFQLKSLI